MLRALLYTMLESIKDGEPAKPAAFQESDSSCKALPSPDKNSLNDRKQGIEQESRVFLAKTPPGWLSAAVPPEASQVFSMNTNQKFDSMAQTAFTARGLI